MLTVSQLSEPTMLASWILGMTRTIRLYGLNPEPLIDQAGIDPAQLTRYGERIPVSEANRFCKLAVELTGDEAIGLRVPECVTHSALYSLDVAMQVAATPREALDCLVRYAGVVSTSVRFKVVMDDGPCRLLFNKSFKQRVAAEPMDAFIAQVMSCEKKLFIDLGGFFYKVKMMRSMPMKPEVYKQLLGVEVEFETNEYSLLFNEDLLDVALPTSNPEMFHWCKTTLNNYLLRLDKDDIQEKVGRLVLEMLPRGEVSRAEVASRLNLSERSLGRRLQERGSSFQGVLDSVRKDTARSLLACKDVDQFEIATQLGFSDSSSFIRTFKRWTGLTPGQYRSSVGCL